jgi:hypothetical protein
MTAPDLLTAFALIRDSTAKTSSTGSCWLAEQLPLSIAVTRSLS